MTCLNLPRPLSSLVELDRDDSDRGTSREPELDRALLASGEARTAGPTGPLDRGVSGGGLRHRRTPMHNLSEFVSDSDTNSDKALYKCQDR